MFDISARARPVLKWAGGKSGPLKQLEGLFPDSFERYVEPFLGGGAVFFSLAGTPRALLNDANADLILLYEVIRNNPNALMAKLDAMRDLYSADYYYQTRASDPQNPIERAARMVFLNKTGFNGLYRTNSKGTFNVPFGKRTRCPALYEKENLLSVSNRLKKAILQQGDFEAVILSAGPGDFVYCDPPYEPVSPTSVFTSYTAQRFSQLDQRRLEAACAQAVKRGAKVAVSNSAAPFVLKLFKNWTVRKIHARRSINSKPSGRGAVPEVLVIGGYAV